MAEKKAGEKTGEPKTKLLMIGGILIVLGLGLSFYEWLRPLTKEEQKAERERLEDERRDAAREAKRAAQPK